jgi:SnoaL-like domain
MALTDELALTEQEVAELRKLLEVERIRKVMQLYSHYFDARDWDGFVNLYTQDAVCEWGPYGTWHGHEQMRPVLVDGHAGRLSYDGFHSTTNFWVELTGPESAVSRSYLTDIWETDSEKPVVWYAMYENEYKKIEGDWKISRSVIQWIWPKRIVSEDLPRPFPRSPIG